MPEMVWFDGKYPAVHAETKFWRFLVKNCKNELYKQRSIEKPVLLNFVNLCLTFFARLSEETEFYF